MKTTILALMSFIGASDIWQPAFELDATHNGEKTKLIRYAKKENRHLYGEHLSFVFGQDNRLLGFVRMQKNHNAKNLVREDEAKKIALAFLEKFAPDVLPNMKILWVDTHDEALQINEKKIVVTGTKVKCQDTKTGLYFWTIIDSDKKVFVFEREIKWISFPGKRGTEKFLHDEWLDKDYNKNLPAW